MQKEQELTSVSDWIHVAAAEACSDLFAAYGVSLTPQTDGLMGSGEVLYCGVIGFIGEGIRGTCLLATTQSPLERSRPVEGSLRDWTGELANQLVGRIKVKLLTRAIRVGISTPVVLRGEHLAPLPRKNLKPIMLDANPGQILLWVEIDTAEGFVLPPEIGAAQPAPEGDLVIF